MSDTPSFADQANEADLHLAGLRTLVERAERKEIKRTPDQIEQMRARLICASALARTIHHVAERAAARRGDAA